MNGSSEDRPAFERGTGFLLARLGSLAARSWTAFLTAHELSQSQHSILVVLKDQGPIGQQHLAHLVAMDARNIVPVLDLLAAKELIKRQPDPADGRRRMITLTAHGKTLADTITAAAALGQDDFLSVLDDQDRRHLNDLLRRLYDAHVHKP
ncbi:MarR family winged helix-turn-helix transcriptional regulator [Streptosporangium sp. NBC_01639]|uniref:MarR family winged helix-turn-helix transcriptional regulator n=1 Tax=unclassified Streptosporangium TaxID=2632669 RepID=UPI002DDA8F18|nr:MarR family winged helix-turn-helix transcriptional regulator [Streptosporangium sp. NBC_01756]WSC85182.1 MarR family winged helix-turn-helix transcriptional regulator [Streptosporangium sp. NBC_01756]WTD56195.1 MarR family winged helix-turn-helix transcriptional regulator [Streptosporangium sp. NBC_01639]